MVRWRIGFSIVTLLLALGGLMLSVSGRAQAGNGPCSLISVRETEALAREKVVKSLENGSVCQRWLAGGRILVLSLGTTTTLDTEATIRQMGGTWESRQFGEITCRTVIVPSNANASNTTCVAQREPLFYGDGFDNVTSVASGPVVFALQVTAGPRGVIPIDRVRVLAEQVLARLP